MNVKKLKSHWNERWQQLETEIPTKCNNYFISDYGRIKSVDKSTGTERELRGSLGNSEFRTLNIRLQGDNRFSVYIHKFVAEHFIEETEEDKALGRTFVNHIDGDKTNNHFKNLRRLNQEELTVVHKERGIVGVEKIRKNLTLKMNESKVLLLKKRLQDGKTKKKILAKNFNISMMQLRRIEKGENWGHVKL